MLTSAGRSVARCIRAPVVSGSIVVAAITDAGVTCGASRLLITISRNATVDSRLISSMTCWPSCVAITVCPCSSPYGSRCMFPNPGKTAGPELQENRPRLTEDARVARMLQLGCPVLRGRAKDYAIRRAQCRRQGGRPCTGCRELEREVAGQTKAGVEASVTRSASVRRTIESTFSWAS